MNGDNIFERLVAERDQARRERDEALVHLEIAKAICDKLRDYIVYGPRKPEAG